jgi:hypothetical protein
MGLLNTTIGKDPIPQNPKITTKDFKRKERCQKFDPFVNN